jgi:hypothetical protein
VRLTVTGENGHLVAARVITPPTTTNFDGLAPGVHTVEVAGLGASPATAPVTSTVLVWPTGEQHVRS